MTRTSFSHPDPETADMLLLVATSAVHLIFESLLRANGIFFAFAAVVWVGWLTRRFREEPGLLGAWGLTSQHLRPAMAAAAGIALAGAALLLALGRALGRPSLPAHFWAVVLIYLGWALVQQVALNGILARGIEPFLPSWAVPLAAGALFSLAHLPDLPLMGLTFVAGVLWVALYLRWPNLWALSLCHGFLGALAYYMVLGRDPWLELISPLLSRFG